MKKEQDFEKAVLDSLSSLKRERAVLEQQVAEWMDKMRKIVEGKDREMTEFEAKLYKVVMTIDERVETLGRYMEATQKRINAAAFDKLGPVLEKIDRAIKSGKL